jgi:hypothetical protein
VTNLEEVREALIHALGDAGKFPLVNARLILRTGVNLAHIDPLQNADGWRVGKVLEALRDMGFNLRK